MAQAHPSSCIKTQHVLIHQALEDLIRALPRPTLGQQVEVNSPQWSEVFVMTQLHGWLRVPN
jgi:hypothetical protein